MYCSWMKIKQIISLVVLGISFVSCRQSCFDVITHNNVAYWSRYWTPSNPNGVIAVYSKKDSIRQFLDEDLNYSFTGSLGDIYSVRFKFSNDTIFHYVRTQRGFITMYDTLHIISYARDTIVVKNNNSEEVVWHRIPNRIIRKKKKSKNTGTGLIPRHRTGKEHYE